MDFPILKTLDRIILLNTQKNKYLICLEIIGVEYRGSLNIEVRFP